MRRSPVLNNPKLKSMPNAKPLNTKNEVADIDQPTAPDRKYKLYAPKANTASNNVATCSRRDATK